MTKSTRRILVLGTPRSGTSWLSRIICMSTDSIYINEPDSHFLYPSALLAKRGAGLFPVATEENFSQLAEFWRSSMTQSQYQNAARSRFFSQIWHQLPGAWKDHALNPCSVPLSGKVATSIAKLADSCRRFVESDTPLIVTKSVHANFCANFAVEHSQPDFVIVAKRPIQEIIASWIDLDYWPLPIGQRLTAENIIRSHYDVGKCAWPEEYIDAVVWSVVALQTAIVEAAARNEWLVFNHHEACVDPQRAFIELFQSMHLDWKEEIKQAIEQSNNRGTQAYDSNRLRADEVGKWRRRLNSKQVMQVESGLSRLGIGLAD